MARVFTVWFDFTGPDDDDKRVELMSKLIDCMEDFGFTHEGGAMNLREESHE